MKKMILTIVAVCTLSATTMAQQVNNGDQGGRKISKQEMIQRRTDRVVKRYGLSDQQAKKLLELNTTYADKMPMQGFGNRGARPRMNQNGPQADQNKDVDLMKQNSANFKEQNQARRKEMQENMQSYNNELKNILTPEQFAKYQEDRQNMQNRAGGNRGFGNRGFGNRGFGNPDAAK